LLDQKGGRPLDWGEGKKKKRGEGGRSILAHVYYFRFMKPSCLTDHRGKKGDGVRRDSISSVLPFSSLLDNTTLSGGKGERKRRRTDRYSWQYLSFTFTAKPEL